MAEQTKTPPTQITCEQCRELLSDYIDRELSESEKASVEMHLESCQKCGGESTRLHGLKKIVQHWDGVSGSGEFRKSVMGKMIRESQQMQSPSAEMIKNAADAQIASGADEEDGRSLPPIWILLVASLLAVLAYFVVLKIRGV